MKKLFVLTLVLWSTNSWSTNSWSANRSADTSMDRVCRVDLVDKWTNYVYDTFTGVTYNRICREGLRECHRAKRERRLSNAECEQRGVRGPGRPYPPRRPVPPRRPAPPRSYDHLLYLSDWSLAERAEDGRVGSCRVEDAPFYSDCGHYVKVNGRGYPQGLGCADRDATRRYGCNSYFDKENAGCLIRKAIKQGSCR